MSDKVRLVRLSKKDVESLEKAYDIDADKVGFQKNDILAVSVNYDGKCKLIDDNNEVRIYRPTSKDAIAFTFADEKIYKLGELASDIWDRFAEAVQMREARKELGISNKDGLDGKNRFLPFLRNVKFEANEKDFEYSILLGSPASLAVYVPYAKKIEKIADKLDKQDKKLSKIMKDINDIKNLGNEQYIEKVDEERDEDMERDE